MRIHTDTLSYADVYAAAERAGNGVNVTATRRGSRKRDHAFNVYLTGTSSRRPNSQSGDYAHDGHAATWDEWGMFLAELFRRDPAATVPGVYETAEHFRWATGARFDTLTPDQQHGAAGHRWEYEQVAGRSYSVATCVGRKGYTCTAIKRCGDWSRVSGEG
jgi:hypothetical protein